MSRKVERDSPCGFFLPKSYYSLEGKEEVQQWQKVK